MKKALLIAYHFPPIRVSSGIQRTLSMARYLRENGWEPVILSITPKAYEMVSDDQLKDVPQDVTVRRAFGRDTARHLAISGRYPGFLALPDRWVSWFPWAVWEALRIIRREQPDLIWSTYPIATAHLIGVAVKRLSGLPWVADFRDSMTEENYPADRRRWKIYRWIESRAVSHADKVVFTAPGAQQMYQERYPQIDRSKFTVIPNGYDEEIFQAAESRLEPGQDGLGDQVVLLHSGVLYPSERDPTQFFDAVAELKTAGKLNAERIRIMLRATGHDHLFQPMIAERGIDDLISLEPGVGYEEALAEMLAVDGLLLFQASNCNHQIPAKVYEYFRTGKPIIALTDPAGDTAAMLREAGVSEVFALNDKEEIKTALLRYVEDPAFKSQLSVSPEQAAGYSRRSLVKAYSRIFGALV